jgi:hypothetical protein
MLNAIKIFTPKSITIFPKMRLIDRFNEFYNQECAASPWGSITSMEHLEATTIRAVIYAFARKYNMKESIPVEELENLANLIEAQGNEFLKRTEPLMKEAQERHGGDLDAI